MTQGEITSGFSSMKNYHVDTLNHGTGHVSPFSPWLLECSEPNLWSSLTEYTVS